MEGSILLAIKVSVTQGGLTIVHSQAARRIDGGGADKSLSSVTMLMVLCPSWILAELRW